VARALNLEEIEKGLPYILPTIFFLFFCFF